MKLTSLLVLVCASLLLCSNTTRAEEPAAADPLAERLFPPDLILRNGEAIGLSDEKRQEILSRVEKAQARFRELESALVKERAAMVALLDREKPDETAVLKQLDNLLAREGDIKREQFSLMLSLRNMLTAPQQVAQDLHLFHCGVEVEGKAWARTSRPSEACWQRRESIFD